MMRLRKSRPLVALVSGLALAAALCGAVMLWTAPRAHIPVPGPDATPEQVVRAYVDAINARDFATADAVDDRGLRYGRFSRHGRIDDLTITSAPDDRSRVHVLFEAVFRGGDGSMDQGRQAWGYVLERGTDGRWHIDDAGVV